MHCSMMVTHLFLLLHLVKRSIEPCFEALRAVHMRASGHAEKWYGDEQHLVAHTQQKQPQQHRAHLLVLLGVCQVLFCETVH